mgnify:CR=1 FL=1
MKSCLIRVFINISFILGLNPMEAVGVNSYQNVNTTYSPTFSVMVTMNRNDFESQKKYDDWKIWLKEVVRKNLEAVRLDIDVEYKFDAGFEDVYRAAHDSKNVGLLLVGHGSASQSVFSGQIVDNFGHPLTSAFLNADPNLRAVALANCYSAESMDALNTMNAFSPYTYRLSYSKQNFDVFVIPDAIRSVAQNIKKSQNLWKTSKIIKIDSDRKVKLTITRKATCAPGVNVAGVATIKVNNQLVGLFHSMACENKQTLDITIAESILKKKNLLEFKSIASFPPGEITLEGALRITPITSSNGTKLGVLSQVFWLE